MEFPDSSISLSFLLCPEDGSLLAFPDEHDEVADELLTFWNCPAVSQAEEEYIEALVSRETSFSSGIHYASPSGFEAERLESVRWILKMKACFGFRSLTAYLAVTYFDRFLLRRAINEEKTWTMKLLSLACLSLAVKKEECTPPFLSEYPMEGYSFSSKLIQKMELFVLDALEWRLESVTPFAYLNYFASKFHFRHRSKNLLPQAIRFIFVNLEAMNLINFRPSTVAAAAILAASGDESTNKLTDSQTRRISLPDPSEIEHVFACYNAMIHESRREKIRSQKFLGSSNALTDCAGAAENWNDFTGFSSCSATSKKRRRQ